MSRPTWSLDCLIQVWNDHRTLIQGQPHFILTLRTPPIGPNTPQAEPDHNQTSQGDAYRYNHPEDAFSMYLDRAIEEDRGMVESWKGNTDGMLVFVSLQNFPMILYIM